MRARRARAADLCGVGAAFSACGEALSPENAQKLFGALQRVRGADGCGLEQVKTDRDVMQVIWAKAGSAQPAVVVGPRSCVGQPMTSGPSLAMSVPATTAEQCWHAIAQMKQLIAHETFGGVVRPTESPGPRPNRWLAPTVVAVLMLLVWLASLRRRWF